MRRAGGRCALAALWLVLFGAYAATLGIDAFGGSDYGGDEPHYLLAAESIVADGDVDLADEYAERAYAELLPVRARRPRRARPAARLHEPHGVGFPLLIAPAYALGGAVAVELFMAAIAALAFVLAAAARAAAGARAVGDRRRAARGLVAARPGLRRDGLPRADRRARCWPAPRCAR